MADKTILLGSTDYDLMRIVFRFKRARFRDEDTFVDFPEVRSQLIE